MLDKMTIEKLHEMKLSAMAEAFRNQTQDQALAGLSFEERFGLIVDIEWSKRKNNRLTRLIRNAGFSDTSACVENIEYAADRKLDKAQISTLATCNYIQERHNIIILGAAGAGKSYLGCAFGIAACRNFFGVKYIHLPELLNDLAVARGEGSYKKVIKEYKRISLLILDEWLLVPLSSSGSPRPVGDSGSQTQTGLYYFYLSICPPGLAQQNRRGNSGGCDPGQDCP